MDDTCRYDISYGDGYGMMIMPMVMLLIVVSMLVVVVLVMVVLTVDYGDTGSYADDVDDSV